MSNNLLWSLLINWSTKKTCLLQLHGIINIKNSHFEFRAVVSEVSFIVGNFVLKDFIIEGGPNSLHHIETVTKRVLSFVGSPCTKTG